MEDLLSLTEVWVCVVLKGYTLRQLAFCLRSLEKSLVFAGNLWTMKVFFKVFEISVTDCRFADFRKKGKQNMGHVSSTVGSFVASLFVLVNISSGLK